MADLGSKMTRDDKEVKLTREQQVSHTTRLLSLESKCKLLESNLSAVNNLTEANTKLSQTVTSLQSDTSRLISNLTEFKTVLDTINKSQQELDEWRLLVQDRLQLNNTNMSTESAAASEPQSGKVVKKELDQQPPPSNSTATPDAM